MSENMIQLCAEPGTVWKRQWSFLDASLQSGLIAVKQLLWLEIQAKQFFQKRECGSFFELL